MEKLPPVSLMKLKMKKSHPSVKFASIFIKTLFIFSQLKAFFSLYFPHSATDHIPKLKFCLKGKIKTRHRKRFTDLGLLSLQGHCL